jgi:hypothetical protein
MKTCSANCLPNGRQSPLSIASKRPCPGNRHAPSIAFVALSAFGPRQPAIGRRSADFAVRRDRHRQVHADHRTGAPHRIPGPGLLWRYRRSRIARLRPARHRVAGTVAGIRLAGIGIRSPLYARCGSLPPAADNGGKQADRSSAARLAADRRAGRGPGHSRLGTAGRHGRIAEHRYRAGAGPAVKTGAAVERIAGAACSRHGDSCLSRGSPAR